jgi:hypothetical protein
MCNLSPYVLVQILSKSWSAPINPLKYQKQTIMKLVEELGVKDTSHGYLPPYKPLVITHTSPNNDCTLLDVTVGVQNSQGFQNVGEVAFKWQEDWVYC